MTEYRHEDGTRTELPKKNIDTGSGLERMACILQGKDTVYDTDVFSPILERIEELSRQARTARRRHRHGDAHRRRARAAPSFLITDGVLPVERGARLRPAPHPPPRRLPPHADLAGARTTAARPVAAVRHRADGARLSRTCATARVHDASAPAEESKFRETLERGRAQLDGILAAAARTKSSFGRPGLHALRHVRLSARTHGGDRGRRRASPSTSKGFEREMAAQRERGRAAAKFDIEAGRREAYAQARAREDARSSATTARARTRRSPAIIGAGGRAGERGARATTSRSCCSRRRSTRRAADRRATAARSSRPAAASLVDDTQSPPRG